MMKKKRFLALVLVITLCLSMIPWTASAAQDSFSSVKSSVEGGTNYMTSLGITRQAIVNELQSHEDDDYYLGTPYHGDDWQSPKGDTSYNGQYQYCGSDGTDSGSQGTDFLVWVRKTL